MSDKLIRHYIMALYYSVLLHKYTIKEMKGLIKQIKGTKIKIV
jgi:hypothetical protein